MKEKTNIADEMNVFRRTIPNSFIALNTSFIISCGFDCDRMPKCHLAFFNDAAPVVLVVAELDGFRPCGVGGREWIVLFEGTEGAFPAIGSNVTLRSFNAKIPINEEC